MSQHAVQEVAQTATDVAIASAGSKAAVGGGGVAVFGALTMNELAMVVGMIVGVVGLLVQIFAQLHAARTRARDERRRAELHAARLNAIRQHGRDVCDTDGGDL